MVSLLFSFIALGLRKTYKTFTINKKKEKEKRKRSETESRARERKECVAIWLLAVGIWDLEFDLWILKKSVVIRVQRSVSSAFILTTDCTESHRLVAGATGKVTEEKRKKKKGNEVKRSPAQRERKAHRTFREAGTNKSLHLRNHCQYRSIFEPYTNQRNQMNATRETSNIPIHRKIVFGLIALFLFCTACERKSVDGDWDDNIHLSTKSVHFKSGTDSVLVTTQGTWWWICNVSVNGTYYLPSEDIDVELDHYTFTQDCFVVERRDSKTLFIKANANTTGSIRTIRVQLEAGDYFDAVTITQAAQ
jgi:hypothetical protein